MFKSLGFQSKKLTIEIPTSKEKQANEFNLISVTENFFLIC